MRKISPTGTVITLENGKKFNAKYGDERTSNYSKTRLRQPDDARRHLSEYENEISKKHKVNELKGKFEEKIKNLDLEQMEKLEAFLDQL